LQSAPAILMEQAVIAKQGLRRPLATA
jgi:hypothetical protein